MDFKSLLQSMDNISETVHKAGPGGYGNRHGSETQSDQYGKPIGKVSLASLGPKDDKPKKKGAPVKPGSATDLKNKEAEREKTSAAVAGLHGAFGGGKMPNKNIHTGSKKHSLKEYIEEIESNQQLDESEEVQLAEISDQLAYKVNQARAGQHFSAQDKATAAKQAYDRDGGMKYAKSAHDTAQAARDARSKLSQNTALQKSRGERLGKQVYEPATNQYSSALQSMGTADGGLTRMKNPGPKTSNPYEDVAEVAPPGAKAERMVKHIKQSYAKDGKLTPKEKAIAYATAWKAHNKGNVEEGEVDVAPTNPYQKDTQSGKDWMIKQSAMSNDLDTSRFNQQTQDFYKKNPSFAQGGKEVTTVGGRLASKVQPSITDKTVSRIPMNLPSASRGGSGRAGAGSSPIGGLKPGQSPTLDNPIQNEVNKSYKKEMAEDGELSRVKHLMNYGKEK